MTPLFKKVNAIIDNALVLQRKRSVIYDDPLIVLMTKSELDDIMNLILHNDISKDTNPITKPINNHIKSLDEIAKKVIELWKQMDNIFPPTGSINSEQFLKIAIMAGLVDAINKHSVKSDHAHAYTYADLITFAKTVKAKDYDDINYDEEFTAWLNS